jgi:uncharacterized coiled-coil protein SlyX
MKTITKIIYPTLALFALAGFALPPQARALCLKGCDGDNANTFLGNDALRHNEGVLNTAIGYDALFFNTTGVTNVAVGFDALYFNTTGANNTAIGTSALYQNATGSTNVAVGYGAMAANKGSNNIGIGAEVLYYNTTGSNNIAIGNSAGGFLSTGDNNIDIGSGGVIAEANTIRIGSTGTQTATYLAGVQGVAVTGAQVVVSTSGQLGIKASSARFKEAIKPMEKASEAILSLHPVSFRYKKELDPKGEPQFGLVAEDVAKVAPQLVARDDQGHPFSVRYDEVNAMLLNEFLKEHRKVETQEATITDVKSIVAQQQNEIETLRAALKAQAAQIQKVSDRFRTKAPAPRVVAND